MSSLSAALASIHMHSLVTTIDFDEVTKGLSKEDQSYILKSFIGLEKDFKKDYKENKAMKMTVHLHELRHFHDLLMSTYGVLQFRIQLHKYFNYFGFLFLGILKQKVPIKIPLSSDDLLNLDISEDKKFAKNFIRINNEQDERRNALNYIGDNRLFSTLSILENIAHSIQMGCIENHSTFNNSFEIQKKFANLMKLDKNIQKYIAPMNIILNSAKNIIPKNTASNTFISNTGDLVGILFSNLLTYLPGETASFPLESFMEKSKNIQKYIVFKDNFIQIESPDEINDYNKIYENNQEYLKNYYAWIQKQIPLTHHEYMVPILSMLDAVIKAREFIHENFSIKQLLDGNEYLKIFHQLPKNPVVFVSQKGIKENKLFSEHYKVLLGMERSGENYAHFFTPKKNDYHCFNKDWENFYKWYFPLEFILSGKENFDHPILLAFIKSLIEIGVEVELKK